MYKIIVLTVSLLLLSGCTSANTTSAPDDTSPANSPTPTQTVAATSAITPSPAPAATNTLVPTPIGVPPSSYQASTTSLCHSRVLPLATGYADFDQDGRIDILTGEISGSEYKTPIKLLIQTNSGNFEEDPSLLQSPPPAAIHPRKVVIADFNLDGLPDAFIADHGYDQPPFPGAQSILLLSTEAGLEQAQINNMPTGFQHSASSADINGDEAPDIIVTDATNGSFFLINDGSGNFSVTRNTIPTLRHGYYSSELIDVDGDG